jgi:hypothetical protein
LKVLETIEVKLLDTERHQPFKRLILSVGGKSSMTCGSGYDEIFSTLVITKYVAIREF